LLVGAGVAAVAAGLVVAVVLLVATRQGGQPTTYRPFAAGPEKQLRKDLHDGGPYYYADPFGGKRSISFALEDDNVVALMTHTPGDDSCRVKWKGSVNSFVDCHGNRLRSNQVGRYGVTIADRAGQGPVVFVDLRKEIPPPAPTGASEG